MNDFYVIEVQEDFSSVQNERKYIKGGRFIVRKDSDGYRIANGDMDFIPCSIAKQIYKVEFIEIS